MAISLVKAVTVTPAPSSSEKVTSVPNRSMTSLTMALATRNTARTLSLAYI